MIALESFGFVSVYVIAMWEEWKCEMLTCCIWCRVLEMARQFKVTSFDFPIGVCRQV